MLPRFRDERCSSGSGWGEAPSSVLRSRRPGAPPAHAGVASQTEAQVGIAGRPLTRETSAGAVWKLSRAIRKDWQGGWKRGGHPDSAVAVADGASTPSGVEAPTQRKLGPPRRQCVNRGSGDPWLCSWIATGCRSRREASGPSAHPLGSSHPASCSGGERTSEARSRRQNRGRGGGLAVIPHLPARRKPGGRRKPARAGASRSEKDRGASLGR